MTTNVKGKTKPTGAKGKVKATGLKEFLSNLATDPRKLGEFLHEPEAAMAAANLSEADKIALKSGVAGMIAARLAGVPLDQAFTLFAVHPIGATPMVHPIGVTPMVHPIGVTPEPTYMRYPPPQYVVYPPQFVVHPPPQYVVYPPQFVVHPPPQYVVHPPQFVVQWPYYPQ